MSSLFHALFEPRRIALIGASADEKKTTSRPQRFLAKHGFTGEILPVNPGRTEILGLRSYKNLDAIEGEIDHAYILLNGKDAVEALAACGRRGVKVASILAGGFADAGAAGASLQDELVRIVRETGIRLVGPNSIGTVSTDPPIALTANAAFAVDRLRTGDWALVSQSGSLIGALLSRADARGIGFSRLISVGNEVDLAVGEVTDLLVDDPKTKAILLFMETLRDGPRLARAARRAHAAGKPVIAYKLGRSEIGQELAKSHTGAIAGSDATFDAFCRRHGIARVSMFESLLDVPALLVGRPRPTGRRVAVATTTGGGAAMVVDNMAVAGLDIAGPPRDLVDWLKPLGIAAGEGKLVDLTLAGAKPEIVAGTIERLLADEANDAVIFVVGSSAQFNPELAVEPLLRFAGAAKPFAVSLTPAADKSLALLTAAGVPAFRHPESCAEAMALCLLRPTPQAEPKLDPPTPAALAALEAGRASGFDERRAAALFAAIGVTTAKALAVPDARRIPAAVAEVGAPVALKILSADVPHKTEAGGVALGLPDGQTAALAAREIEKRVKRHVPGARLEGFLVQKMERGLAEVILGFRRDPLVGPTVTVGLGGVLAEIYKDAATRIAPVDEAEARAMIEEVKGLATIRGYRNLPRGDVAALAQAIAAFSRLAHDDFADVAEAEINPLLVKPEGEGVVAVDGLVLLSRR
ncbi:Acyl-CoA synthetase (NDP forming) [Enhydrobacter aerosaccus]|uniref:Acyl-CoA synthetase (NDP forming) n=1 Tax=Enhydrobacter aerosaccus TaxID=225324 RepID=A0A1T4T2H6_9HYPH|nr:acetate--CoA ligase [Enhydrobacter aerosaccus]SKA34714.1 Acyl-CoA synthetase (NDP forming) [Enhydrobacter aerosaccus]